MGIWPQTLCNQGSLFPLLISGVKKKQPLKQTTLSSKFSPDNQSGILKERNEGCFFSFWIMTNRRLSDRSWWSDSASWRDTSPPGTKLEPADRLKRCYYFLNFSVKHWKILFLYRNKMSCGILAFLKHVWSCSTSPNYKGSQWCLKIYLSFVKCSENFKFRLRQSYWSPQRQLICSLPSP